MSLADRFRLLKPVSIKHKVGEEDITFYQCSPKQLASTARLVAHLAGSISNLFADRADDSGHTIQDFSDPETGEVGQTTQVNATSPQLVAARAERRRAAIENIIEGLLSDAHREQLMGMIVNSMRDEVSRSDVEAQQASIKFLDNLDIGPFSQFFIGMMKANASVFGELGKKVVGRVQEHVGSPADESPDSQEMDG